MSKENTDFRNAIKTMFKGYRVMTKKMCRNLKSLGFSVVENGKHYKIFFDKDLSHGFILPKTTSDYRTGRNFSSLLIRSLCL